MGLEVIANIYPAEGKVDAVRQGLQQLGESVKANEPGVTRYQMYEQTNAEGEPPQFVVVEEYTDQAAFDDHVKTDIFKELGAKIQAEGLLAKPLDIKFVKRIGGYWSK